MRQPILRPFLLLAGLLLVGWPFAAAAEERRGPADPAELEAFLDGLMAAHLANHHIAGATVAVVRDGELLLAKGYGRADVATGTPVDPATTLFRIGSVSKLFTWTAVLQLWEQGRLDLDADVNDYLDFRIPATYPEPITLRDILTHTPGFEDRVLGLFGPTEGSRGEWLRDNLPARVRPPGTRAAYSNYASALAGYIVERLGGQSWEQYIEDHILAPLGITHATGRQPLPEQLAGLLAQGYVHEAGRFEPKPFEWIDAPAPAGSMSASAEAMVPFMLAHLQEGRYRDARILQPDTVRKMHARAFTPDPRINGLALGFYEKSSHGLRIIGHAGGTQWFHTDLALIPAEQLGLFVSFNSAGAAGLNFGPFLEAFLDRYYPEEPELPAEPLPGWSERSSVYAGHYRFLRRAYSDFEKLIGQLNTVRVSAVAEGELLLRSPLFEARLTEIEPGRFRAADGTLEAVFEEDGQGGYSHLHLSVLPMMAAERVVRWQNPVLQLSLLGGALLVFLSMPLVMLSRYLLQRGYPAIGPVRGPERVWRWIALIFSVASLGFIAGLAVLLSDIEGLLSGTIAGPLQALLMVPPLSLPFALAVLLGATLAPLRGWWTRLGRWHYLLFTAAVLVYLLLLWYWNLLGWPF